MLSATERNGAEEFGREGTVKFAVTMVSPVPSTTRKIRTSPGTGVDVSSISLVNESEMKCRIGRRRRGRRGFYNSGHEFR